MRICSLLPSITEILFELGLGDQVVGVTHECDWPPAARQRPPLTKSRLDNAIRTSAEIDREVREQRGSLYDLDVNLLQSLAPDIILTQSLCPVCAVDEMIVRRVATRLPSQPRVESFHPTCLSDVYDTIRSIGTLCGKAATAGELIARFHAEVATMESRLTATERRAAVLLEWTDPPFVSGHWTPELMTIAGGIELLGKAGQESRRVSWDAIVDANPDVLVVAPCGYTLEQTVEDVDRLRFVPEWAKLGAVLSRNVFVCDGSAYFNRPGPRLIESLRIVAEVLHPELFSGLAPAGSFQQLNASVRNR